MYESSCSYAGALELKRSALKEEPWPATEWPPYRLHQSTFEQLKQSVEKAKAALQDRSSLLGTATAFGDFYGGQLGQDTTGTALGFGRSRNDDMLVTMDKAKTIGSEKLSGGHSKSYAAPTLTDTLRATKNAGYKMANKEYYENWLKLKEQISTTVAEDERLQELAQGLVGIKPQSTAIEIVAKIYCKYCELYNKLCDCYDQMEQVQRRPYIKKLIDAITCRLIELKNTLEEVEAFEFTYPDNSLQQFLMVPQDIEVLCPFFYPFEIRRQEMQYIIDQVLIEGNRIGDPTPTPSEIERKEEEHLEEERTRQEEKEAEIKRKLAMGEDIVESIDSVVLPPEALEELRQKEEYQRHMLNIQRMERSRVTTKEKTQKINKDANLYLELAGLKKPPATEDLRIRAANLIQQVYRNFMQLKRDHIRENRLKHKLGMILPSWDPPSAKIQLEKVKADRRKFRHAYYEKWLQENVKEKSRVLRLRENDIMEDISAEIRQWFQEWYNEVRVFDEFPWPEEGGSILVVQGETFNIEEYIEWRLAEEKRLKAEEASPKSKEQIKAEKLFEREERKRLEAEARDKEKKRISDYKKFRLNPDNDPGVYILIGQNMKNVRDAWDFYENQWKAIDTPNPPLDAIRGQIMELITENAYKDAQLQVRPIVDEMMRLELNLLKASLKSDYNVAEQPLPLVKKRKKPKKVKPPRPEKLKPERMFQKLVDEGIIKKYPKTLLSDYWGDRNYAAADMRAVQWTPSFPPPCIGDVREQVRIRCLLTLGCSCPKVCRTQLLVGPKSAGKRTLVYAIATETNSILIDLSSMNVYDKFPGPKNLRTMFTYVSKISKLMQPTIILIENAEKTFYKKVPKEEKLFDPTRLQKFFFKEVVKPIGGNDKILVLGTAAEPWLAKTATMYKAFPNLILLPRTDYGSLSLILSKILMKYHGVSRDFNVHSVAQALRGYDINTIRKSVEALMSGDRVAALYHKPLHPLEVVSAVIENENANYVDNFDYAMFTEWYQGYSPWGEKYRYYMLMLESQLAFKLKAEKKNKV